MRIEIVEPPESEPVTLDEAKAFARITLDDDDDIVTSLIVSAREFVENYTNRALIEQTRLVYLDLCDMPLGNSITLPFNPLTIESINSYDSENTETEMDDSDYFLSGRRVALNQNAQWPNDLREFDCLAIETTAGYGDDADSVPVNIKTAILQLVAHTYEHREAYFDSTDPVPNYQNVPYSVTNLLQSYRIYTTI